MENTINNKNKFKCINFLLIFYIIYATGLALIIYHYFATTNTLTSLAFSIALISIPFILDDIVAEVYGIKYAVIFYFSMTIIRFLTGVGLYFLSHSYLASAKYLFFIAFYYPLARVFSWYINIYLLTKWKILTHGKYFWLRSIGASSIAILIFCLFLIVEDLKFFYWPSPRAYINYFILSYFLKILFLAVLAVPSTFIVNILKIIESQYNTKNERYFNPFKKNYI